MKLKCILLYVVVIVCASTILLCFSKVSFDYIPSAHEQVTISGSDVHMSFSSQDVVYTGQKTVPLQTSLSVEDFIETCVLPLAKQSTDDCFTADELTKVLKLGDQTGHMLREEDHEVMKNRIFWEIGYSKGELVTDFLRGEYGKYPSIWPIEIQSWWANTLVHMGVYNKKSLTVPALGELSQEEAEHIAQSQLTDKYGEKNDLGNKHLFEKHVQYVDGTVDGQYPTKYWDIRYVPLSIESNEYHIFVASDGLVLSDSVTYGIASGVSFDKALQRLDDLYGYEKKYWPQTAWQSLKTAAELTDTVDKRIEAIRKTEYPDVPEHVLSADEAYEIAARHLGRMDYSKEGAVYIQDDPHPVWKVFLSQTWYAEVDSVTGEVKTLYAVDHEYEGWICNMVLKHVLDALNESWIENENIIG